MEDCFLIFCMWWIMISKLAAGYGRLIFKISACGFPIRGTIYMIKIHTKLYKDVIYVLIYNEQTSSRNYNYIPYKWYHRKKIREYLKRAGMNIDIIEAIKNNILTYKFTNRSKYYLLK